MSVNTQLPDLLFERLSGNAELGGGAGRAGDEPLRLPQRVFRSFLFHALQGQRPGERSLREGVEKPRGCAVGSRVTQITSNGRSLSTRVDGSATWPLKTVISALSERGDQSAICNTTLW